MQTRLEELTQALADLEAMQAGWEELPDTTCIASRCKHLNEISDDTLSQAFMSADYKALSRKEASVVYEDYKQGYLAEQERLQSQLSESAE